MIDDNKIEELEQDLAAVLNKHSIDTDLATPDFILAKMVVENFQAFGKATVLRRAWFKNQLDEGEPLSVKTSTSEDHTDLIRSARMSEIQ